MLASFVKIPRSIKVALCVAVTFIIAALFHSVYQHGYSLAKTEYELKLTQKDLEHQKALAAKQQDYLRDIGTIQAQAKQQVDAMRLENENLQEVLERNSVEASQAPDAAQPALGPDSVRRLNQIR